MAGKATKSADSPFYIARMEAAAVNDKLNSREGAAEVIGIERTRMAKIERGVLVPYPEEVLMMADTYNAPEICNYYCSQVCLLGRHTVPAVELLQLDRLTIKILSALGSSESIKKTIIDVVEDGVITPDERPKVQQVLESLENISKTAIELKLWVEKNIK